MWRVCVATSQWLCLTPLEPLDDDASVAVQFSSIIIVRSGHSILQSGLLTQIARSFFAQPLIKCNSYQLTPRGGRWDLVNHGSLAGNWTPVPCVTWQAGILTTIQKRNAWHSLRIVQKRNAQYLTGRKRYLECRYYIPNFFNVLFSLICTFTCHY